MPKVSAEGQTALEGKCKGLIESLKTAISELSRGSHMKSKYLKVIKDVEGFLKTGKGLEKTSTKPTEDEMSVGNVKNGHDENEKLKDERYVLKSESASFDEAKGGKNDPHFPFDICTATILEGVEGCKSKGKALLPLISAIQHLLCISDLLMDEENENIHPMLKDLFRAFEHISTSNLEPVLLRLVQTILQLCSQNSHILSFSDLIVRVFHIFDSLLQSKVESVVKCGFRQLVSCVAAQNIDRCIIAPNELKNEGIILQIVATMCNILRSIGAPAPQKVAKSGYGFFKREKESQVKPSRSNTEDITQESKKGDENPSVENEGEGALFGKVSAFALRNLDEKLAFGMLLILVDSLPSGVFVTASSLQNSLNTDILPCINHLLSNGNPRDASALLTKVLIRHVYYAESHKSCEIGVQLSLSQFEDFIHMGIKSLSDGETSKAWINCFKQLLGSPEFVYASMCSNLIHRDILGVIAKFKDVDDSQRVNLDVHPETDDSTAVELWHKKDTCQISHLLRPLPLFGIEVNADSCALDVNNVHKGFSIENMYLQCVYNCVSTLYTMTLNCARDTVYYVPYKILYMDGSGIKCSTSMDFRSDVETLVGIIKGFKKYDRAVFTCLQGLLVVSKLKGLDDAYKECIGLIMGKHMSKSLDADYDVFTLNSTMCMCSLVINFSGVLDQEAWLLILERMFCILYEHTETSEFCTIDRKSTDSPKSPLTDRRRSSDTCANEEKKTGGASQYFMRKFVPIIWSILKSKIEACDSEAVSKFLIASGSILTHEIHRGMGFKFVNQAISRDYGAFITSTSQFLKDWEMLYIELSRGSNKAPDRYNGTKFEKSLKLLFSEPLPCSRFGNDPGLNLPHSFGNDPEVNLLHSLGNDPEAHLRYHNFLVKVYIVCTDNVPFTSYKLVTMLNSIMLYTFCSCGKNVPGVEVVTSYIAKKTCSLITQVCISNKHSTSSIEAPLCLLYQLALELANENFLGVTLEQLLSGLYSVALSVFNILDKGDWMLEILYTLTEICTNAQELSKHSGNIDVIIDIFVSLVENSLDYLNEKTSGEKFAKCLNMLANSALADNVIFRVIGLIVDFADHLMNITGDDALLCTILSIFKVACLSSNVSRKNCAIKSLALFIQTHLHSFERRLWDYTCKNVLYSISEELREKVDVEVRKYVMDVEDGQDVKVGKNVMDVKVGKNVADVSANTSLHSTISALSETQSLLLACKEFSGCMIGSNMLYCAVDVLNSLLRGIGSSINAILKIKSSLVDLKSAFSTLSTILVEYRSIRSVWNTGLHLLDKLQSEETKQGVSLVLCAVLTDPNAEMGQTEEIVLVCLGKDVTIPPPRKYSQEMLPFVVPPWLQECRDGHNVSIVDKDAILWTLQDNQVNIVSSMASVLKIELRDKIANSVGILQDMQLLQLVGMNYVPNILTHQGVQISSIKTTLSDAGTMENITAYFKEPPLFKIPLGATQFTTIFSCMKNIKEANSFVSLINCLVCKLLRREIEDLAQPLQFLDYIACTFHELTLKFVQECVNDDRNVHNDHNDHNVSLWNAHNDHQDDHKAPIPGAIVTGDPYTCVTLDITKKTSYTVNVDYMDGSLPVESDDSPSTTITAMFRNALLVSAPMILDGLVKFTECNPHTEIYIISYQCALDIAKCAYVGAFFDMHINGYVKKESLVNYWCALQDSLVFYRKSAPLESSGINFTTLLHSIAIEFITSLVISPFSIAPHFACQTFVDILDSYATSKSPILCRIALQRLSDAATWPQVFNGTECQRIDAEGMATDSTLHYRMVYVKHAFFLLLKHLKSLMKGTDVEKLAAMQIAETIVAPPTKCLFTKDDLNKHKLLESNKRPMLYLLYDYILEGLNGSERVSKTSKKLLTLLLKSIGVAKFDC